MEKLSLRFNRLYDEKRYTEAIIVGKWMLRLVNENEPVLRAQIAYNQGCILLKLEMYDKAAELFSTTTNTLFGKNRNHPLYIKALQNLAIAHHHNNQEEKAIYLQNVAINLLEEEKNPNKADILNARYNLANFYLEDEIYEEAIASHLLLVKQHESQSDGKIDSFLSLARCFEEQNDFEEAFNYVKKALYQIRLRYGEEHDEFTSSLFYAAKLLLEEGEYDKCLRYANKALKLLKKSKGKWQAKIEVSDFLSDVAFENGNINKAIAHKKESITYFRKNSNENHLVLANEYNQLAQFYSAQRNDIEVTNNLKIALDMKRALLGSMHTNYIKDALTACLYWLKNDEISTAYTYIHEIFTGFEKMVKENDGIQDDEAETILTMLDVFEALDTDTLDGAEQKISSLMQQLENIRLSSDEE